MARKRLNPMLGILTIDNGGKLEEYDTMTCCHCGSVVVLNKDRKRARGYCPKNHAYRCDDNACASDCRMGVCPSTTKLIDLAQKHPGLPVLPRGKQGQLLFDPALLQEGKVY